MVTLFFSASLFSREIGICPEFSRGNCSDFFGEIAAVLSPVVLLFLFSIITYKMNGEVYKTWIWFARWWIPMTMFFVLITQESSNMLFSWSNKSTAGFLSLLFLVISLILIIYKSLKLRGK
jgi:hypothetical protein